MTLIILIVAGVLVVMAIGIYNQLVSLRNRVTQSFADIDVQLKQRHDLIPNLVETVKGYATHEKGTLEAVIQARNAAMASGGGTAAQAQAEGVLGAALGRLIALSEAYPDLKANENFLSLQEELTSTEDKIAYSRQFYNDSVLGYNTKIQSFPANLLAGMFNFTAREYFEGNPEEQGPVTVQF